MQKSIRFLVIAVILTSLIGFIICLNFITTWLKKQKAMSDFQSYVNVDIRHRKPFPANSVTGPLQLYYQQWLKRSDASFVPEVQDYRVVLRLRLQDFIDANSTNLDNFQNITFKCYSASKSKSNPSNTPILTIKISVSLHPTIDILTQIFQSSSSSDSEIRQIKNPSIQKLIFPLPLLPSKDAYYKFSYRTDWKHDTMLQWPAWPLSLNCSLADSLRIIVPQKQFSAEKKALSSWLDFQYEVSNFNPIVNYRRMHPFERASKKSVCSSQFDNWILKYQIWHSEVAQQISAYNLTLAEQRDIILKLNIRFIVVKTFGSGLADRMTHLIATYLIAILTQRFLLLDDTWPEFHEIMRSSLAYRSEIIAPWLSKLDKLNSHFGFNVHRFFPSKLQTMGLERLYKDFNYDKEFPERVLLIKSHVGNVIHTLTSSSSVYASFLNEKLHMTADNLFGCLYHSLIIPRLSTLMEISSMENENSQYLLQSLMFPQHPTIGIQIRAGDSYMNEEKPYLANSSSLLTKFSGFFDCAQNLSNGHTAPLIYLISDSVDLRLAALTHWPFPGNDSRRIQVIASSKPAKHVKYTSNAQLAFRMAVFETFLFSLCDTHIITTDSGFGRFGAFASLRRRPFYSFNQWEHPFCAIGEGQVTFMHAGHQWSGV